MTDLDADAALQLALLQGQSWMDATVAARVAVGAEAAAAAVMAALAETPPGFTGSGDASFLATLEALREVER
jgi:hypothetical protein